jgi:hypothetical protein
MRADQLRTLERASKARNSVMKFGAPNDEGKNDFFDQMSDCINPLTPNDLQRLIKTSYSKNMRKKPTNAPIIHSVY